MTFAGGDFPRYSGPKSTYKPPKEPKAKKPKAPKKVKAKRVPASLPYVKLTPKNPVKALSTEEKIGGALGGKVAYGKIAPVVKKLATAARGVSARAALAEAGGAVAGTAAVAGLAAYFLTKFSIQHAGIFGVKEKAQKRENAFRAAQAYRALRLKLQDDQGYPLTKTQLRQTSNIFKNRLLELGFTSNDLSTLPGLSAYE